MCCLHRLILVLSFIGLGLTGITLPASRPTRAGAETGQSALKSGTNWHWRLGVDTGFAGLESQRKSNINPFIRIYRSGCHARTAAAGGLDLQEIRAVDELIDDNRRWI
jgi:hypothetical protein